MIVIIEENAISTVSLAHAIKDLWEKIAIKNFVLIIVL
jgi:hypothetical protein